MSERSKAKPRNFQDSGNVTDGLMMNEQSGCRDTHLHL